MDNKVFNVNGRSREMLIKTVELYYENDGHSYRPDKKKVKIQGYKIDDNKGFLLKEYGVEEKKGYHKFPVPVDIETACNIVWSWIQGDESAECKKNLEGWDADADHDGDNELGWRVYTEEWGHIDGEWDVVAIKPAYMWYGK